MIVLPVVERLIRRRLRSLGIASREVSTSAGDLHLYESHGPHPLPPLVILHGFGANATAFARVLAYLRTRVGRMLAPDAPAHGFSSLTGPLSVDHAYTGLSELLVRELDRPAIIFGNSMGGAFAIRFALDHPDRVRGLFLSSPAGAAVDAQDFASLRDHFRVAGIRHARRLVDSLTHKPHWLNTILAPDILWKFSRGPLRDLLESFQPSHMFTTEQLAELRPRTHLVWGRSERVLPSASLEFFRRALPDHVTYEEPEDFGHCPHMDRPYVLAAKIAEFVRARAD
jgi:pimeloyl-ACP methyl ester carboxylesterase